MKNKKFNLKFFDTQSIVTNFRAYLVGSSRFDKNILIDELLFKFHKTFDIIIGISITQSFLALLRKYIPKDFIYTTCNMDEINTIVNRLFEINGSMHKPRRILIVIDDSEKEILKNYKLMHKLYKICRLFNISIIMDSGTNIHPAFRSEITHFFAFRDDKDKSEIKKLLDIIGGSEFYKNCIINSGCLVLVDQPTPPYFDVLKWCKLI